MILRKAAMRDIPALLELINSYATQGVMLPRSDFELAEGIRDFTVAADNERLIGCAALHFYTPTAAEVRSLAVLPGEKGRGIGRSLVGELEREARDCELASIFAFTYVPDFFARLGFVEVDRGLLPLKAWKECLRCPKFQCCDEIAVLKQLRPANTDRSALMQNPTLTVLTDPPNYDLPRRRI
jgi:amino-acid N-acetyltransferase